MGWHAEASPKRLVDDLDVRLTRRGDPAKRAWWERYLKGVVEFYGVGTPEIRRIVADWHREHGLERASADHIVAMAGDSIARPVAENKLAAIILLQQHALGVLGADHHLAQIADWFDEGHIADWNVCDWMCVRVLGPIAANGRSTAGQIAAWTDAPVLWRRRAAGVAFVNLAPRGDDNFDGFVDLVLAVCDRTVADPQRFAQTGTGWVLRELSKAAPDAVAEFVRSHLALLSREAVRMATARLAEHRRRELLRAHTRTAVVRGDHAGR